MFKPVVLPTPTRRMFLQQAGATALSDTAADRADLIAYLRRESGK